MLIAGRVRETLLIEHQTWFFQGDIHHIEREMEQEGTFQRHVFTDGKLVQCYEKAEDIRRQLLERPLLIANSSVGSLQRSLKLSRAVDSVRQLQTDHTDTKSGFLSNSTVSQANDLLKILNGKWVNVRGSRG